MTIFLRIIIATGLGLAALPSAAQDCTVFEHRDYGGARRSIAAGEVLAGLEDPGVNQTCSHSNCAIDWQPNWNDDISSFRVRKGCTITLSEHIDGSRIPPRGYGAHFRSSKSYRYVGSAWNDKASLVECSCRN
ncbi:hypothetical protein [Lysobacter capsici]|uniref:hypothetical protein n=1 Tax=Lysobacter capsici TaxID=435897 RepID=UPI001C007C25|nr:hypothetical protein [Lysobacter capsici]QWF16932.1 hypothetical protein KME82_24915 [Lysobacter capsici]